MVDTTSLNVLKRMAPTVLVGKNQLEWPVNWSVLAYHCKFVADMLELANYEPPKQLLACFEIREEEFQFIWLALNGVPDGDPNLSVSALEKCREILDYLQLRETTHCYRSLAKLTAQRLADDDLDITVTDKNLPILVRHHLEIELQNKRTFRLPKFYSYKLSVD